MATWRPAYSLDRRWWFDGSRWLPVQVARRNPFAWPRWAIVGNSLWLVLLLAWEPATTIAVWRTHEDVTSAVIWPLA